MSFPMEVFEDILSRLPVKPLLRFRCVSPAWRDLIDNPNFVKLHLARSIEADSHLNVILCSSNPRPHAAKLEPSVLSLEATELHHHPLRDEVESEIQVWGSCNGLVCLTNELNTIALWNPSTREFMKLPDSRFRFQNHEYDMSNYQCRSKFGFGYDKVNDDYKVLNIMDVADKRNGDVVRYQVKVYSLKSNLWGNVDFHEYHDLPYIRREPGVLAGGALHWVMGLKMDFIGLIVAFDLGTEKWRTVHFPNMEDFNSSLSLGCFGDSIWLGVNYLLGHIEYWVMREYGVESSWSRLFSLLPVVSRPFYFPKSGGEVLMQHNGGLIWFDVENSKPWYEAFHDDTKHNYMKRVEVGDLRNISQVMVYMDSLVTIRGYRTMKDEKKLKGNWENKTKPSLCSNFQLPPTMTIPTGVLENILSRLPVETLLRFRCVSPPWRDLIDTPYFIKLHLSQSIEADINLNVITTDLNKKRSLHAAKFKPSILTLELNELDHHPLRDDESGVAEVWGSCNGLLCVGSMSNTIVLWNPSTRRFLTLPCTSFKYKKEELDMDISNYICSSGCGFGYDTIGDDYKVVKVMDIADMHHRVKIYVVKVYSLKSNSWHAVENFCQFPYVKREYTQYAHNSLHWLMGMEHDELNVIVAFDLHSETCRVVPGPRFEDTKYQLILERFQDSISLLHVNQSGFSNLWVMREYGVEESWAKLFSLHHHFTRPAYFPKNTREVFMQHDGRLLWCDTENDEDPWYDPEDDTKHEYLRIIQVQRLKKFHRVEMYTASLVPLGRFSKVNNEGPPKAKKKKKMAGFLSKGFNLKL